MIVLSLFDGMSGARLALDRAGIFIDKYYASEIDKYAIEISNKNFPDIVRLGNIKDWEKWSIKEPIDLIIAGFSCQPYSNAGKKLGLKDVRGKLVYDMLNIIKHYKPKYYILENVRGLLSKKFSNVLELMETELTNVDYDFYYELINSKLVSAQKRNRVYFTNFKTTFPEDKNIILKDILISGIPDHEKAYCIDANYSKGGNLKSYFKYKKRQIIFEKNEEKKGEALVREGTKKGYCKIKVGECVDLSFINSTTRRGRKMSDKSNTLVVSPIFFQLMEDKEVLYFRKLMPIECERLQTMPDDFTKGVSNTQRYKMIGNGFTIDVIVHLLNDMMKGIKNET